MNNLTAPDALSIFLTSVYISVVNTLLITVIGVWAPIYIERFKANAATADESTVFVSLVLLFVILFFSSQRAQQSLNNYAQGRLESETAQLKAEAVNLRIAISTLPPEQFLQNFSRTYTGAHNIYRSAYDGSLKMEDLEDCIRSVLSAILQLTMMFSRLQEATSICRANIMTLDDSYKTNKDEEEHIMNIIRFHDMTSDIRHLKAVLVLQSKLTASSTVPGSSDIHPDFLKIRMALPVPVLARDPTTDKFQVLPGAPYTALNREAGIYNEPHTIKNWMKNYGDFKPSVCKKVEDYFEKDEGKDIKTFMSVPLSVGGATRPECIAVLNLHCNQNTMLNNAEQFRMYLDIMAPFNAILSELVEQWKTRRLN